MSSSMNRQAGKAFRRFQKWFMGEGAWWCASFVFHMLLVVVLIAAGQKVIGRVGGEAPQIDAVDELAEQPPPEKIEPFQLDKAPLKIPELSGNLDLSATSEMEAGFGDMSPIEGDSRKAGNSIVGGIGNLTVKAFGPGPIARGTGLGGDDKGVGIGAGSGTGHGFGGRGAGVKQVGLLGGTLKTQSAVEAALNWLYRHQNKQNGSWNLITFNQHCAGGAKGMCNGSGIRASNEMAATALALLPFLASGQTHETKGPYKGTIYSGLYFLLSNQKPDGDLRGSNKMGSTMYDHGLAAICLCEAYGLSRDAKLGERAQLAINFIQKAQNPRTGGWRYYAYNEMVGDEKMGKIRPYQDPGDTSVLGWQIMALKSGQMAGLIVDPKVFERGKKFLASVASGNNKGYYGYTGPEDPPRPSTTAVGMLCQQYMGMNRDNPAMVEGTALLLSRLPNTKENNDLYEWYYATQVLHNMPGPDWDQWNRVMRRTLVDTQCRVGCAAGSWNPNLAKYDLIGGRLYTTALSTLTLEVYYRYLPLYQLDSKGDDASGAGSTRPSFDDDEVMPSQP